jgi:3D-(3,5/4)-trihydroxycyclohexane-1,2-dione acylhydrolase (decyclizing)
MEYGYSCMGYEVAGGMGVKMAAPDREVFIMVGDGSWLMMSSELVTARQEGVKLIVVLIDNGGYGSIGALSTSLGSAGFGTQLRFRGDDGALSSKQISVDFAANAASLGLRVVTADSRSALRAALVDAKASNETTVIVTHTDPSIKVGGYESWWDVPPAEITTIDSVKTARVSYDEAAKKKRWHI